MAVLFISLLFCIVTTTKYVILGRAWLSSPFLFFPPHCQDGEEEPVFPSHQIKTFLLKGAFLPFFPSRRKCMMDFFAFFSPRGRGTYVREPTAFHCKISRLSLPISPLPGGVG